MKGFLILRMVLLLELLQQGLVFGRFLPSFSFTATAGLRLTSPLRKPPYETGKSLKGRMHWVMNWAVMPPSQRPLMKKKTCTSWSIAWHAYLFDINCILAAQASFWEGQELNSKYALSDEKSSNASISKAPHEKRGKYFLFHSMTCLPFRYQLHLSCWGLLLRRARA